MRRFSFVGWSACVALAACGGGGGSSGDGATEALWSGQYHAAGVSGPGSGLVLGRVTTNWGVVAADGAGLFSKSVSMNRDGVVPPSLLPGPAGSSYAVDADRTLRLSSSGGETARGRLSADGRLALVATTEEDEGPSVDVFGLREGAWEPTSLSGTWRMVGFAHAYDAPARQAVFGTISFDASGEGAMTVTVNSDGGIGSPAPSLLDYRVWADGSISVVFEDEFLFEGGVARGGDVILLAGGAEEDDDPTLMVLVREGAVPSLSSLAGSWFLAAFSYDVLGDDFFGLYGDATTDASGNFSASLVRSVHGVHTALPPVGGSWTVDPAGIVTLTTSGGVSLVGRAAPGLDFVVLGGGTGAGSDPAIFLLLR